jgi:hypothetical protein
VINPSTHLERREGGKVNVLSELRRPLSPLDAVTSERERVIGR